MKKLYYTFKTYFNQFPFLWALRLLFFHYFKRIINDYTRIGYAQTGEDDILQFYFNYKKEGFYIDVGCHHPIEVSNTFKLYCEGWRGINIDANPDLIKKFKRIRKRDISITAAVSDEKKEVTFYEFSEYGGGGNTIDEEFVKDRRAGMRTVATRKMTTRTLNDLLEECNIGDQKIDFLSIDVEGHDFKVLKSINLSKYRPSLIIIEMHDFNIEEYNKHEIFRYLNEHHYKMIGFVTMNGFFVDEAENFATKHEQS
ncbi:MAG: FkbM family methyltransferase [Saprospiraceae bacterium]|nr:FkbM family methyltransferase [Saprospiraceae bacterium]